jgi:hypothetical protein
MKTTTLKINHNGFHGFSTIALRLSGNPGEIVKLSESQIRKLKTYPCGMSDCRCGESMVRACLEWGQSQAPEMILIPVSREINLRGNYPQ